MRYGPLCLATIMVVHGSECSGMTRTGVKEVKDLFFNFDEVASWKRRRWALFCGCGPSMNEVDKERARVLERTFDIWGTNQFFLHDSIVPRFMHVEFKPSSMKIWQRHFDETKQRRFANTTFITEDKFTNGVHFLRRVSKRVFAYNQRKMIKLDAIGGCDSKDGAYRPTLCGPFHKKCSASATVVMQIIALLKYDAVFFLGVDLVTKGHFWSDNDRYPPDLAHFHPTVTGLPHNIVPKFTAVPITGETPGGATNNASSSSSSSSSGSNSVVHATALRGFHLFLSSFTNFNNIDAVNLSPHSAHLLQFPFVPLSDLLRCGSDTDPDDYDHLRACVLHNRTTRR